MADRYFVKVSGADFDRIMGVLRLRDEVVQEMWTGTAWVPTEVVMAALVVDPCSTRCPPRRPSGTPPSMSG